MYPNMKFNGITALVLALLPLASIAIPVIENGSADSGVISSMSVLQCVALFAYLPHVPCQSN